MVDGLRIVLPFLNMPKAASVLRIIKPDCIRKMKELVQDIPRIEVKELMTKYPQGGEAYFDLCSDWQRDQFFHAPGRCGVCG